MSHTAAEPPGRRRLEYIGGSLVVIVGVIALVVAVMALHHPGGRAVSKAREAIATDSAGNAISTDDPGTASAGAASAGTASAGAPASAGNSSSSSTATGSASTSALKQIPLIVLNNTTVSKLAATAQERFVAGGWTVTSTGNLTNNIASTCAYYDPSDPANQQAAELLQSQFPAIKRVKARFSGLPSGPIVVVLASDYS